MPEVLTIRETVQRAQSDSLPISEYTLRRWIKTGAIPVRKVGAKALIFYPNLVRYLQCCEQSDKPAATSASCGIRRVDV